MQEKTRDCRQYIRKNTKNCCLYITSNKDDFVNCILNKDETLKCDKKLFFNPKITEGIAKEYGYVELM